jgi:DNA-binding NtrC family response regulator
MMLRLDLCEVVILCPSHNIKVLFKMATRKLKILIAEDDNDVLFLYNEYFTSMGHIVIYSYLNADNLMANFDTNLPDICVIDYKFQSSNNGLDAAAEILKSYPSMPILFITGYENLQKEIAAMPFFQDKKISVLLKPAMLAKIEEDILRLTNNSYSS